MRDRGSLLFQFSVRDERDLCSQPHDFLSCMRELRQHLSRETSLPVLETKRYFLLFRGNSLRQLRSKKTSVSSANVSPKTLTKAYRLKVSKCCMICSVNLTANSSFYRPTYAGLSEKLEKLLRTSIEPRDTKYVCKICYRRAELLIKKRNVLDSLDSVSGKISLKRWQ